MHEVIISLLNRTMLSDEKVRASQYCLVWLAWMYDAHVTRCLVCQLFILRSPLWWSSVPLIYTHGVLIDMFTGPAWAFFKKCDYAAIIYIEHNAKTNVHRFHEVCLYSYRRVNYVLRLRHVVKTCLFNIHRCRPNSNNLIKQGNATIECTYFYQTAFLT